MGWLMWCYQLVCLQLVLLHSLSFANLCSNEQSSALLHFKQLFSFYNDSYSSDYCGFSYPKMMDWKEETDCCSWDGITCDRVTGHVIGLDLSCSWLHGTIPSNTSLFLLSHLQKLNLAFNDFNLSRIPYDFVRFPSLTHLNLFYSNFSGQVPLEISHLSKLISLDLSRNDLTLETLVMKGLVQNMSQLQELFLDFVNMSTVALGTLTNINLLSLKFLGLHYCELQGPIPSRLFSLPSLEAIYLGVNKLSGPIPSSISELVNLTVLSLSFNQLSGPIPSSIFELVNLTFLNLSFNQLSGPIPSSIFELVNLTFLNLFSNHLSGMVELYMFAKLKNLEYLALSRNSLSINTTFKVNSSFPKLHLLALSSCNINEFPEILSTVDNLKLLDLSDNKIYGHIPNWLPSLETIYLRGNQLSGPIPSSIFELVNLTHLDLSSNHLSGVVELSMFTKLKNLEELDLSNNSLSMSTTIKFNSSFPKLQYLSLSSCNINEFPKIFSTADNLETLDLSDNKIHGHIPNWLFNISTLSSLDLHSNLLQGLLPAPPPSLSFFSVAHNNMTGAIPSSFCNLSSIQYLDLSNNSLYGMIPQCLGNSTTISVLDLRMNNFHGNIPQTFANGSRLTTLNLNGNQLEGSLPTSLVNCVNLEVLDLGNNMINDTFPHWLATLPELQVLILRFNRFYGPLGNSRTRIPFSKLRILDLSHNGFNGPLRTRFFKNLQAMMSGKNKSAQITYMEHGGYYYDSIIVTMKGVDIQMQRILTIFTTIDLSSNKFQGEIPDEVGKLNSLILLNFSHNILIGHIPLSLENLIELESLDLSSNRLGGEIPAQLTSLTSLSVLNLSFNQLAGLIPQGKQFNTFENNSYIGNLGLCGLPLSKKCSNDEQPKSEPTIFQEDEDTWSWFDWKIIMMGYGSGLVIGLSMGYIVFSTGKPWWFVSLVERKVIKLSERRGRRRRN